MPLGGKKDKPQKKSVGALRRSQIVTTFCSGAIADLPNYSVIMGATNYWDNFSPELHEESLQRLLKVNGFREPLIRMDENGNPAPTLPAFRFPSMHFCPGCNRLMPYWGFGTEDGKKCGYCKDKKLVPSRFVAACCNGHLEDFPYRWWVHGGNDSDCPKKDEPDRNYSDLEIKFSDDSGGLESIIIHCKACGKTRSMAGCMSRDALKGYHCGGRRPWIGYRKDYNDPIRCEAQMRCLQRSASNVYFSLSESALTIPPWSTALQLEIDKYWSKLKTTLANHPSDERLEGILEYQFESLLTHGKVTMDELKKAIWSRYNGTDKGDYTRQKLREDEYRMFCEPDQDDPQFKTMHSDVPDILKPFIDDIVLVKRLREVLAVYGFRRITPEAPSIDNDDFKGYHMEKGYTPLSDGDMDWLPAIQMQGEGIFIRLNEEAVEKWSEAHLNYYQPMQKRLEKSKVGCDNFSPRYVLLHTLSHLLIRQLSIECGYSGASIKERIYSTWPNSEHKMAGILLYTSASDSDGSLGGLVRKGLAEPFEVIFRNMLQEASWCSSDPICIESRAQGLESLNYAACHACALLPETSCEMRNCLLDRAAVTGTLEDRNLGYFGSVMENI